MYANTIVDIICYSKPLSSAIINVINIRPIGAYHSLRVSGISDIILWLGGETALHYLYDTCSLVGRHRAGVMDFRFCVAFVFRYRDFIQGRTTAVCIINSSENVHKCVVQSCLLPNVVLAKVVCPWPRCIILLCVYSGRAFNPETKRYVRLPLKSGIKTNCMLPETKLRTLIKNKQKQIEFVANLDFYGLYFCFSRE